MSRQKIDLQAAKDQAADYFGFASAVVIDIDDEEFEIPHPQLMSDDQRHAIDQVKVRFEDCQREADTVTPDVQLTDGSVIKGGQKTPGPFKDPRRDKTGALMEPSWPVSICVALWGEDKTKKFLAAGGPPGIVEMTWSKMDAEYREKQKADPKSK